MVGLGGEPQGTLHPLAPFNFDHLTRNSSALSGPSIHVSTALTNIRQPNYRAIAKFYGQGATYDTIEGRFRHIRRQAEVLKLDAGTGTDSPGQSFNSAVSAGGATTPKKARAPRTPKKESTGATAGGRITKTPTGTPTKGRRAANGATPSRANTRGQRNGNARAVKEEVVSGESSMVEELNDGVDVDWMARASQASGAALPGDGGEDDDEEQGLGNANGYRPDLDGHVDAYWEGEMV